MKGQGTTMEINRAKFEAVIEEAKAKTNDRRWRNAIEKAADAILNGKWIITELFHCYAITTESGKTYRANSVCQCEAFFHDQPCKHRAAARLLDLYETAPEPEPAPPASAPREPRITRSVERDVATGARVNVVRCDGWMI